jgi:hypothetical protein
VRRRSKVFSAGLVIVLVGCALVAAASFPRQTMPAAAAPAQLTLALPPPGSEIPADPALLQALVNWLPSVSAIPPPSPTGGRDTELLDCHSGKVNLTVTHGWCFASPVRLFYNVSNITFLDPLTGQLFTFDAVQNKLLTAPRLDRVQQELEPPHLPEKHSAAGPNPRVTGHCTNGQDNQDDNQQQDSDEHVRNSGKNADRSDSPVMQKFFREQAQWWRRLCP